MMDKHIEVKSTPAANWRQEGKTDPHNTRYECQRVDLTMGQLTDDEIANAVFLCDHRTSFDSIVYLTAAKDRIRWLSRSNEALIAQLEAAQKEHCQYKEALHVAESLRKAGKDIRNFNACLEHLHEWGTMPAYAIAVYVDYVWGKDLFDERKLFDFGCVSVTAEAALSAANERLKVPAGHCIMPKSL
ncbi:hypothetical protein, partial [Yersinia intermedia]|uniref:hypothetical protein n=1 Tax=Yersinia intermedia TaxID=631 RepID=UPI0011A8B834